VTFRALATLNVPYGTLNSKDSGYHETLTRFWLLVLRSFLNALPRGTSRVGAVEQVIVAFAERKNLYEIYYTFDVAKSQAARESWIPPDKGIRDLPQLLAIAPAPASEMACKAREWSSYANS
jgi:hypothetical protein